MLNLRKEDEAIEKVDLGFLKVNISIFCQNRLNDAGKKYLKQKKTSTKKQKLAFFFVIDPFWEVVVS